MEHRVPALTPGEANGCVVDTTTTIFEGEEEMRVMMGVLKQTGGSAQGTTSSAYSF